MVTTPSVIGLRDGRLVSLIILVLASCRFMADPDSALGVSSPIVRAVRMNADKSVEDFALMEASCTIVKILQSFPNIRLPDNHPTEPTGQEKQSLGIVITSAEGCKVVLN